MGLFDGFPFKSQEQIKRERKDFEKRVFPLGEPERLAVEEVLKTLLEGKLQASEKLFAFISAKDQYTQADPDIPGEDVKTARRALNKQHWLSDEAKDMILAFIKLESKITSLDDMPSVEMVRATAWSAE